MGTLSVDKILKTSQGAAEFTLPATDGAAGQVWQTDGAGQLSVAALAADTVTATQIAANAVTATQIAANAVTTTEIVDNAVTGAKIAMGSDAIGDLLYYNGTDYVRLAAGTADQLLTSAGAAAPTWAAAAGGGKVLQVVEGTTISTTYITSITYVDIGMYISITPSATTSKIYVSAVYGATQDGGSNHYSYSQLNREESGETDVGMGGHVVWYDTAGGDTGVSIVLQKLDAPATTAALTYQVQARVANAASGFRPKAEASIVAMEIGV